MYCGDGGVFCRSHLCAGREIQRPRLLGTGAEVPRHHYRMYSDDDPYVDGAAAFSERSATPPAGSDVLSQLVGAGKDAFCERFGVRLLTSYGMTETIVGIIGDRPGDKRRWPSIGRAGFATKRRSATITIARSRQVRSVKSVLKAYQGKPSSKSIFSTRKPLRKCWKPTAGYIPAIPDTATKRAFLFRRSPLQYDQTRWRECLLRGAGNIIATHPKFRISWLWVLKIRFAMKPSKHLWC